MSQYAPPPGLPLDPAFYSDYGGARTRHAPASIKVLSILAVILGAGAVLCNAFGLVIQAVMLNNGGRNPLSPASPTLDLPGLLTYRAVSILVTLVFSIVLLAGGIGGLKARPLARKMMVRWAMALLCWVVFTLLMNLVWIGPAMTDLLEQRAGPRVMHGALALGVNIGFFFGAVVTSILPTAFLICWRSPKVVAAFESGAFSDTVAIPLPPSYFTQQEHVSA